MANRIEIWQPRWHDRKVLIARHKVSLNNEIVFTKAPTLPGVYQMRGAEMEKYPVETNGRIECYAVPLTDMRLKEE